MRRNKEGDECVVCMRVWEGERDGVEGEGKQGKRS